VPRFNREDILSYIVLVTATLLIGLPFYWMLITALKPIQEIALYPPRWLPGEIRWQNFSEVWQAVPFGRFYLNSLFTTFSTCFLQLVFAGLMAYGFAFIPFPHKQVLFFLVLATMMIPEEMKIVPNYLLLERLGWVNTYWSLIIPPAAQGFPVFVLYMWFRTLPRDLLDAAKVDGAGHWRTFWLVVVPASRPMVIVLTLFAFVNRWNDYLWTLIVTNKTVMRTLPVGLAYFKGTQEGGDHWNLLMAAALLAILPLIILFLLLQRRIVEELPALHITSNR